MKELTDELKHKIAVDRNTSEYKPKLKWYLLFMRSLTMLIHQVLNLVTTNINTPIRNA